MKCERPQSGLDAGRGREFIENLKGSREVGSQLHLQMTVDINTAIFEDEGP